ncbi:MAG: MMPL family transporter [Deltaproteobacteria bacterium]|nr:MMPL family transporter [Deltaproteobacteria bacterium]
MHSHSPSLLEKMIRCLIPYAWIMFPLFLGLTWVSFKPAVGLLGRINTELSKLLPEDYPSVKIGNEIKRKFKEKGGGDLIIVLDSPNPGNNLKVIGALADFLQKIPEVDRVQYIKKGFEFFDEHKLMFIELDDLHEIENRIKRKIQREKLGSLYIDFESEGDAGRGKDPFNFDDLIEKYRKQYIQGIKSRYFTNEEETIYALWIYPKSKDTSLSYYKKFYGIISHKMKDFPLGDYGSGLNIGYAGSIKTRIDEYNSLIRDLKLAGMISGIGIFILLAIYFRRVVAVILIFVPLVCSMLMGFALCSLFIKQLNVVTSFLFSILFGLGVDIGIHMFARYIEDREAGLSQEDALVNCLLKAGRSSAVGVFTTCASFFILIINDFKGFSEFGWIAGIGLLAALATYLLFFPAILLWSEKLRILRVKRERHETLQALLKRWPAFPKAMAVTVACVILALVAPAFIPSLQFEWNYSVLKIHLPETQSAKAKLKQVSGRVNSPAAVIIGSEEEAEALKKEYARRKAADKESPTIDYFRSYYDLFPKDQEDKMTVLKDIDKLLADDALNILGGEDRKMVDEFRTSIGKTTFIHESEIPEEIRKTFFGKGDYVGEKVAFVYPISTLELDDGRNAVAFYNDAHKVSAAGKTFYAVSDSSVFADVLTTMFRDSRKTIILSLLVLALLIYLDFRDWKKTGLVLGALCSGIFWMFGCMVVFGLKFNFYNMITIPMVIGMGEDNSVHLIHRNEELKRSSVMRALFTSGSAALMASLTTMLGYAGLIFAHHPGLRSIGILAVIGMGTCMLSSLVFLPAFLQVLSVRSGHHGGHH